MSYEVLRHSVSGSNEPDVIDVSNSFVYSDDDDEEYDYLEGQLQHHGVKGQKWGVVNEDPRHPRQSRQPELRQPGSSSSNSSGHPYYSPNTGNGSHVSNTVVKRNTGSGTNTSISEKKTNTTPDLTTPAYSDSTGVHCTVGIGNTGYGVNFTLQGRVLTSLLDRNEDILSYAKNEVYSQLESIQKQGGIYKKLHLTDKQIDMIVWRLMYQMEGWKKNYYKPGVFHSLFTVIYKDDNYLEHHGILGMKWGVRRYQNSDGSLTEAGRKRYIDKKYR